MCQNLASSGMPKTQDGLVSNSITIAAVLFHHCHVLCSVARCPFFFFFFVFFVVVRGGSVVDVVSAVVSE